MKNRGRPRNAITRRRKQVLDQLCERASDGARISLGELARRCGLHDYRSARRIVRDLEKIGAVNF